MCYKTAMNVWFLTGHIVFLSSGSYGVILDERHYRELLMQHVIPPVAKVSTVQLHCINLQLLYQTSSIV